MSKEIVKKDPLQASLEVRGVDQRAFRVLKEKLYPNVCDESLLMAIDYCKARKLDIFKRSIQIVPIWDNKKKSMQDTFWPSITEVRITATRTGKYAGISEAEFGEDVTEDLSGITVTYPKWCKLTVYRLVAGEKCAFSAKLFWKQEYKTAKNDTSAPNSMWNKRTHSQLEKCTEAAALRKAFPEELGNEYIAEEAFDANEALVNVTPKSKTANAHTPPVSIEKSFNAPMQTDLEEAVAEFSDSDDSSLNTHFSDQDQIVTNSDDVCELAFKRVADGIKSMANANSVKVFFERSAAEDLKYLQEFKPKYYAELLSVKNNRLEELK